MIALLFAKVQKIWTCASCGKKWPMSTFWCDCGTNQNGTRT